MDLIGRDSVVRDGSNPSRLWIEKTADDGSSIEISIADAIDVDETERKEMKTFRRALSTPSVPKNEVLFTDRHGRETTALEAYWLMVVAGSFVGALLFTACLGRMVHLLAAGPVDWGLPTLAIIFAAAFTTPLIITAMRFRRRKMAAKKMRGRFTLTLSSAGLECTSSSSSGSSSALSASLETIDRFEADARQLTLIARSGARAKRLPLSLGSAADNAALAERLNEELVRARASGGYRGPRIALDHDHGHEKSVERVEMPNTETDVEADPDPSREEDRSAKTS